MAPKAKRDRDGKLQQAFAFLEAGDSNRAAQLYRELIDSNPDNFLALHYLGIIEAEQGRLDLARLLMARSLGMRPADIQFFVNYATLLLRLGDHASVLQVCEQGLKLEQGNARLLHARAVALYRLNRFEDALATFDRIVARQPRDAGSHYLRGCALAQLARHEDALAAFDRSLRIEANSADAWCGRGNVLQELRRFGEAAAAYQRAIALQPNHVNAWLGRGNLLLLMNSHGEACAAYERVLASNPNQVAAWNGLAVSLGVLERNEEAFAALDKVVALRPADAAAWLQRGLLLDKLRRHEEAHAAWRQAGEIDPTMPGLEGLCLRANLSVCRWPDFAAEVARLTASVRGGTGFSPWSFMVVSRSMEDQLTCARQWASQQCPPSGEPLWRGERYAHDRIRLAYVSSDFRDHPVAYLTAGLFARHDRSRFETTAISLGPEEASPMRARLRSSFDRFLDLDKANDREIAETMRRLEIDIAVDLNGFTEGSRPNVFAQRPAPVQVSYLGYAGTLGHASWDYIIADRFVIPDDARSHYAERVVHLPDSFMVNDSSRPIAARTPSRAEAGLPEHGFVFCAFNKTVKISPDVFDVWMRLLGAIEGSVLWLSPAHPRAGENLRREAAARGISPERIIFAARVPSNEDHLARHRLAELFLDTLNYNAHSTAADALWAGLPVLTCAGETFASRVAGSLNHAIGLPELTTTSVADYEALALALARDPARLKAVREKLARNRDITPLFDTGRFTRHIEQAFATMWERSQRGEAPAAFAVAGD